MNVCRYNEKLTDCRSFCIGIYPTTHSTSFESLDWLQLESVAKHNM